MESPTEAPHPSPCGCCGYKGRVLPPEEYSRLAGLPIAAVLPRYPDALISVVEHGDPPQIVATWMLISVPHLEGAYIAPGHRRHPAVVRQLTETMYDALRTLDCPGALTLTQTPEVDALATKLGGQAIPGTLWYLPVPAPKE